MSKKMYEQNGKFVFCTQPKSGYEHHPNPSDSVYCSTQITLVNSISLPDQTPPCQKVVLYVHTLKIQCAKKIDSIEIIDGKQKKGKKLIITGLVHLNLEYITPNDPLQKIYCYNWEQPFDAVLPQSWCDNDQLFPCDFNLNEYMVYTYTEYLEISCKTETIFDTLIALRIWLQKIDSNHSLTDRDIMDK
ncbi:DUF3794 domain-containing protein [Desulfitobacterium metallireducens]|uniref:SipL SPOCS domain-containing protein n=1 Tax=Desulfitobacterium metallireducens DSM 15288 TaxID=871968 RepID=W0EC50_9FIRM|nr:DUF3794 domain-containing protein [Desulfitobacterium metallireducens]AHF08450.1 hypothetical protein DESME_03040 [Desulfitobacterium metallireducens DSM 15288]